MVDAVPQYIVLSDMITNAYHTKVAPQMMHDPAALIEIQQSLKAFIDDIMLHMTSTQLDNITELQQCTQSQLQWWAQLVEVTHGELNPKNVVVSCISGNWIKKWHTTTEATKHPKRLSLPAN